MAKKVGIIGAGIGGLATAIRLSANGFKVEVFEKNSGPGGKISEIQTGKYRFDMGPSVFTMPELVDQLYEIAGKDSRDHFHYDQLDASCKYFFEDGTQLDAYSDERALEKELKEKTGEDEQNIRNFLSYSKNIYNLTSEVFVFNSIHELKNLFKKHSLNALFNVGKIDAFRTMHQANTGFFKSDKVVQLFDRYATYNGSNPYQVPGTLNIIPHLEHNLGTFFPEEGMYSIVRSLEKLAKDTGVNFHYGQSVKRVEVNHKVVTGVSTDQEMLPFDYIVSDVDINYFYEALLPDRKMLEKVRRPEKSSSALIFYWGMKHQFPGLKVHNILFAKEYRAEFNYLFNKKEIYPDPTVYLFISSKAVPGDAPEGHENWYVMINAPENVGQDWGDFKQQARKYILEKIQRMLGVDPEPYIDFEKVVDPVYIENFTSSYHGSLYGNSSNSKFAAFNRHPNFSKKYQGLYFAGGSVHPGGGIPLCIASAKIVSNKIIQHEKNRN